MARIRYLKPEFFSDEDLAELPYQTRLAYAGLWCYADKAGRLEYRPKFLKAMIFPYDNLDIEKQIDLLSQSKHENGLPFIQKYEVDGTKYIQILKWEKHQKPHHTEAESKIPPAPPLKNKGNGNGKAEQPFSELSNVSITVKKPLKNISVEDDSVFWNEVRKIYTWLDINEMISKMKGYQLTPKGKHWKMNKRSVISWLNRQDKPIKPEQSSTDIKEESPDWIKEALKDGWK